MREMKLYVLDWEHINPQRGAILDKYNQVFGADGAGGDGH